MRFREEDRNGLEHLSICFEQGDEKLRAAVPIEIPTNQGGRYLSLALTYHCATSQNTTASMRLTYIPSSLAEHEGLQTWPAEQRELFRNEGLMIRKVASCYDVALDERVLASLDSIGKFFVKGSSKSARIQKDTYSSPTTEWPVAA